MIRQEIAFMGRVTAGLSHEIKNVLAIIKESSGLLEDLLLLTKDAPIPKQDKFLTVSASIRAQIERGVEITNRLNRLAHSMDAPQVDADVNDLLEQVAFLMHRFVRARQVHLKTVRREGLPALRTDPFHLQMLVAAGIDLCLPRTTPGGELILTPAAEGPAMTIDLIPLPPAAVESPLPQEAGPGHEARSALAPLLQALEADLTELGDSAPGGLRLTVPSKIGPI